MLENVFLSVFNRGVAACWLIAAVIAVRPFCPKSRPGLRMALWAAVGLRLACPFSLESALSLVPSAETLPQTELFARQPMLNTGISAVNSRLNPDFIRAFAANELASVNPLQLYAYGLACLWLTGTAALLVWSAVGWLRLRRCVAANLPLGQGVYLCDAVPAPFVFGLAKPRIYLPAALPQAQYAPVIAHEKAHIARGDHWWKPLAFALAAVYWFLPPVWLAWVLFCRDLEYAADRRATRMMDVPAKKQYAAALLACGVKGGFFAGLSAFGEVGVKGRIRTLLCGKKAGMWAVCTAALLCGAAVMLFAADPAGVSLQSIEGVGRGFAQNVDHLRVNTPQGVFVVEDPAAVTALCGRLSAVRLHRGELSANRSMERPSDYSVSLHYSDGGDDAVTLHFDLSLSTVWASNGVKPSLSHRVKTIRLLQVFFREVYQSAPDAAAYFTAGECLYRSPASSHYPQAGVSGFRYRISRDSFCFIDLQTGGITAVTPQSDGFFAMDGGGWMPAKYTPESWQALFPHAQDAPLAYETLDGAMALAVGQRHTLICTADGQLLLLEGHKEALSLYTLVPETE